MEFLFYFESQANCKQNSSKKAQGQDELNMYTAIITDEIFHNFLKKCKLRLSPEVKCARSYIFLKEEDKKRQYVGVA